MNHFSVAAIQMVSTSSPSENMQTAARLVQQASLRGAQLVLLPEYFCLLSPVESDKWIHAEQYGHGPLQTALSELAARHQIWLIGGTLPLKSPVHGRVFNSQLVYAPDGQCVARYDKIHLFNFKGQTESYDEGKSVAAGDKPIVVSLPFGKVGLSTCYDLRFPELYRSFGAVDLIVVPSAFTATTGRAHWEPLLRARAIENQCYVLAAAQGGEHAGGRLTWGHSLLVDPWGEVVDALSFGEGILSGVVSLDRIQDVRQALPALSHRVLDY